MLAAAMRREPGSLVKESSRNYPETDFASPHRVLLSPQPQLHTEPRMSACGAPSSRGLQGRWEWGVSQRIEYGSVGCVLPVASCGLTPCRRAGIVFGGDRRFGRPGFRQIPPWRIAAPHTHHASRHAEPALRVSLHPSRPSYRHLARVSRWNAGVARMRARACRRQCQSPRPAASPRHGDLRRLRFVEHRR